MRLRVMPFAPAAPVAVTRLPTLNDQREEKYQPALARFTTVNVSECGTERCPVPLVAVMTSV